jgi:hypothetical protein
MSIVHAPSRIMEPAPKFDYFVRQADPFAERDTILATCRGGGLIISDEQYRWRYEDNPLGPALCWLVVERKNDTAVGHLALFSRRLLANGRAYRAAVVGDFVVNPAHRTFWPAVLLQKAAVSSCRPDQFNFLYAFPNQLAGSVLLRAGYRSLGNFRAGVRLLQTKIVFRNRLHRVALSWAADAFDAALKWVSKETWRSRGDMYVQPFLAFDQRFDVFWAKILPRFAGVIGRDATYANWRFISAAHKQYSIFAVLNSATHELAGYIVWSAEAGKVLISDVLAFDYAFDTLLGEFLRMQRQRNANSIVIGYVGGTTTARKFQQFGFIFRRSPAQAIVYGDSKLLPGSTISGPGEWFFIDGDADV